MAKETKIDMCNGPVLSKMLIFTIPLMCSGVLQLLFNAADIVVVGKFAGDDSLAAVGANTALINLLTNIFIGLSVGANVQTSRKYGAKKFDEVKRTVHTSMMLSVISGLILAVVGVCFAPLFLKWMNTPDKLVGLASVYLRVLFLGMPASMVYNFGAAILRSVGDTKRPLAYLLISGVVNVILNIIFVLPLNMDVAGVGLATIISQYLSAALIVNCLMKEQSAIKLVLKEMKIHKKEFLAILRVGLPAGFQGMVFSLSNVVIQSSINLFGEDVVAGNSAAANIEGFVYIAMNSFYQAAITFMSQNVGAGKYDRIRKIAVSSLSSVVVTGVVLGWMAYIFGHELMSVYSDSQSVIEAGVGRMRVVCTTYALCGIMDVMVGLLRGLGYSMVPMVVSLIGACGLRLVWLSTVFQMAPYHKEFTIYASYPISWVVTVSAHVVTYFIVKKMLFDRVGYKKNKVKVEL